MVVERTNKRLPDKYNEGYNVNTNRYGLKQQANGNEIIYGITFLFLERNLYSNED
jgi:hypothetical protein